MRGIFEIGVGLDGLAVGRCFGFRVSGRFSWFCGRELDGSGSAPSSLRDSRAYA